MVDGCKGTAKANPPPEGSRQVANSQTEGSRKGFVSRALHCRPGNLWELQQETGSTPIGYTKATRKPNRSYMEQETQGQHHVQRKILVRCRTFGPFPSLPGSRFSRRWCWARRTTPHCRCRWFAPGSSAWSCRSPRSAWPSPQPDGRTCGVLEGTGTVGAPCWGVRRSLP